MRKKFFQYFVMKGMVECLMEEGGRGPDYVQERARYTRPSFSHGMTPEFQHSHSG